MNYYIQIEYLYGWDPRGAECQFIEVGSDGFAIRSVEKYEGGKLGWATRSNNFCAFLPEYHFPSKENFLEKNHSSKDEYQTRLITEEEFEKIFLKATI